MEHTVTTIDSYSDIIKNYPKGTIMMFDEQYRCRFSGGKVLPGIFEHPPAEGTDVFSLFGNDLGIKIAREINKALQGYTADTAITRGREVFTLTVSPVVNGSKKIHKVLAVFDELDTRQFSCGEMLQSKELELQEAQNIIFNTFQSIGDEIHVINSNQELIMSNTRDVPKGENSAILTGDLVDRDAIGQVFSKGEPVSYEIPGIDEEHLFFEVNIFPIKDQAGFVNFAVFHVKDITKMKRTEKELQDLTKDLEKRVLQRTRQLEAANKELEAFSYSASHDLRAPLRGIDGFSHALMEDYGKALDGPALDYLKRIRSSTQRMASIIEDLISLSRISRSEMNHQYVNLSKLVTDAAGELKKSAPDRKAEFIINNGLYTNGDQRFLRIVMENLIGNAWKYTGKRETARIEFGSFSSAGKRVFYIKDNGSGFDMQYADQLFAPFRRLHNSSDFPGTGIGLATVMRIIHRHGGSIWAHGEIDNGATFYFTLWDMNTEYMIREPLDER
ncbi:MAG: sensor histidine kinase [Spirochaetia bacterium]